VKSELVNRRALYVEDDLDTCEIVKIYFNYYGYQVTTVHTASEGLELAKSERFDIHILDNWIRNESGIELCRQIRVFDLHTPIIFISGAARERDREEAFAVGAQDYLIKPVDLDHLYHTVKRLIEDSRVISVELSLKS
jgi:two-component system response regulator ResD